MATWPKHVLIAWGGRLGNPAVDVWTNTLKVVTSGSPSEALSLDQQETVAAGVADLLAPFHTTIFATSGFGLYGRSAYLDWVKVNSIGTDGKYVWPSTTVHDVAIPATGSGDGASWRDSLAITLRTDRTRGRAHAGRFYPAGTTPHGLTAGSPYISSADATSAMNAAVTLINGINGLDPAGDGSIGITVANVSAGWAEQPSGLVIAVSGVEVDRVLDTQKRRTNRVPRSVVSASLV